MSIIFDYFPELTQNQRSQYSKLGELYRMWNQQINVVSRKDIDNIEIHHVLHSLAIAKVVQFCKGTNIMDVGTGGGLPGIPLAIMFPNCHFTLVDSIGKKTRVAQSIANELELSNVAVVNKRAEAIDGTFDFVVSRAVAPLPQIARWVQPRIKPGGCNTIENGIICLKGGNLSDEVEPFRKVVRKWSISSFFEEEYFNDKFVLFLPNLY